MTEEASARAADARNRLDGLRQRAVQARRRLQEPVPPHLAARHTEAAALTERLILNAGRNMSLAFVGIFTTGKSLLASLLVGMARLLVVANVASTGNITRLVLRPAPAGTAPRLRSAQLSFLSRGTTAGMAAYLLDEIVGLVDKERLPYDFRALKGHRPVDEHDPARSDWSLLERTFGPLWTDSTLNLEIKQWATELFQLRDALGVGAGLLPTVPGNARVAIDPAHLDAAIRIGNSRVPPSAFPQAAVGLPLSAADLDDVAAIRAVLPLIHEVILEIALPQDLWSFGGLTVDLLDFPGLASDSLRDRYLSHAELGNSTVMVVVVDAKKPKQHDNTHLYTLLQQQRHLPAALVDSVVAVINRFDRLAAPARPARDLRELTESTDVAAALAIAGDLTRQRLDRVAVTSALAAATRTGFVPPDDKPEDAAAAVASLTDWGPTAEALATHCTGDAAVLATTLGGYRADGGVDHLRHLLARHLTGYGIDIWLGEAEAIAHRLDTLLTTLYPADPGPAASPTEQARLVALCDHAAAAHRTYLRRLAEIRQLDRLPYAPQGIVEAVRDEAARIVHDWPEWATTHESLVTRSSPEPTPADGLGGLFAEYEVDGVPEAKPVATTTAAFSGRYRTAASTLDTVADDLLRRALSGWTADLIADPDLRALADAEQDRHLLRARLLLRTPEQDVDTRLRFVESLYDPTLLAADPDAVPASAAGEPSPPDLVTRASARVERHAPFPLAANRALTWHEQARELTRARYYGGAEVSDDPIFLIRIRHDLVEALTRYACQRLQAELDLIHATVRRHLDRVGALLPAGEDLTLLISGQETRR
ncbi:hypothetical protein ABZ436_23615 [Micromonospora matsumotoense]|uniref:hypothetical protein n=1 Tax=Micromonospora matsumotoense TaxID=121616 RepID=UPI0033F5FA7D